MKTTLNLSGLIVKAARADLLKSSVVISFEATISEETLAAREQLMFWQMDKAPINLVVVASPRQVRIPLAERKETEAETNEPEEKGVGWSD